MSEKDVSADLEWVLSYLIGGTTVTADGSCETCSGEDQLTAIGDGGCVDCAAHRLSQMALVDIATALAEEQMLADC